MKGNAGEFVVEIGPIGDGFYRMGKVQGFTGDVTFRIPGDGDDGAVGCASYLRLYPTPGGGGGGADGFSQDESSRAIRTHSPGRQDTAVLAAEVLDSFMFVYLNLFMQSILTDSSLKSKYSPDYTHW